MPVIWTDAKLNARADAEAADVAEVGLHDGDPGASGTDNEATGGTPAYARVAPTFEPAGDEGPLGASQPATVGIAWGEVTFDVPAGDWSWLSFWATGDVFLGRLEVPQTSTAAQDTVQVSLPFNANL